MDRILLRMLERLGRGNPKDPLVKSAIVLAKIDMREYLSDVIEPGDMSITAQKLRAKLRKM